MLHVVLHQPEIPQNTGNIGRMCAITQSRLHLIHPLGFVISDRQLKRSGMDYWRELDVEHHADWNAYQTSAAPSRCWLLTTKAERTIWDVEFAAEDALVFGNEGHGAPESLHQELEATRIMIPQFATDLRSLNLSTAAGIVVYEALRQIRSRNEPG
ncbi:tRNA (cytidine(34)-2'-O)-methyltransferase [Cerasicoccus arenae]|uniref:Putative tRNA (cytidine(34)-2'-O)-methyltransferase n=1 Tax=Cerasicoccus arenae TaxID=424488 RepID=A0A8J3DK49_9BACT|nr:tRNA (cytidine(34)-2'-O)-methyltransferase [Cerasicoccus arenae]MBK1858482.1 tRNA (cytidine(34)-2'-O)-methyltransferase [Cerasicoccus arenae]GHC10379.1 putative tRNA (cytidine(34)-2'-O)-methyltransferase [Cerasicoccus arenae]